MTIHLLLLLLLHTHLSVSIGFSDSGLSLLGNGETGALLSRACAGKVGECGSGAAAEEFEMHSEVSGRMLIMQKKYISYETLKRDAVPCSVPGASYYNCGSGEANRYSRGCNVIAKCAKSIRQ